ncbi:MAG: alpha/beta hydrolase [Candidatus Thiodiazotropha sp. (ex Myrtea spinifera)]|nr:alpha/beta hydrolase [Candidatus Thiodiazotropha sp. (ex Myrtea spinifera)]MCU7829597.1 alpha/beta hydrolase [Candidatus Thiodiazotropha sp. (ex Myrtea sp. 'scaly one' KF741663)]
MYRQSINGIIRLLLVGMVLYGGLLLYLYVNQYNILYLPDYPTRQVRSTPALIGLDFEPVTLTAADGVRLNGWFIPAEAQRATLLFFHGNAGNISHRLDSLRRFHQLGLSVLIIDYRGYGDSEGEPSEAGIYQDADAAWRYLTVTREIPAGEILLLGRSFGGAVAAYLASQHAALGVVLESTFTSAPEMAAELYPWLPARWLTRFSYDTRSRLADIQMPLMVIHSRGDEIIPFSQGSALYEAANEPKQFLELNGSHNDGLMINADRYRQALNNFISVCLTQREH